MQKEPDASKTTVDIVRQRLADGRTIADSDVHKLVHEIDDLRTSVIAFGGPWAVKYAEEWGLPPKHLDPRHYDILKNAGARMDDFIRGSAEGHG